MTLEPEGDYTHVNVSPEGPRLTQGILTENLCQNPHHAMRLHCQNPLLKDYISTICNVRMMLEIIAVIRVPCIVRQTPVIIAVIRVPCIGRQTPVIILWVTRGGEDRTRFNNCIKHDTQSLLLFIAITIYL